MPNPCTYNTGASMASLPACVQEAVELLKVLMGPDPDDSCIHALIFKTRAALEKGFKAKECEGKMVVEATGGYTRIPLDPAPRPDHIGVMIAGKETGELWRIKVPKANLAALPHVHVIQFHSNLDLESAAKGCWLAMRKNRRQAFQVRGMQSRQVLQQRVSESALDPSQGTMRGVQGVLI